MRWWGLGFDAETSLWSLYSSGMVEATEAGRLMNIGMLSFLSKYVFVYKELSEIERFHFQQRAFDEPAADLRYMCRPYTIVVCPTIACDGKLGN
jgi:hypothetical protein